MDRKNRRAREMRAERKELKKAQQEQQKQQQELPPDYDTTSDNEVNDEINQDDQETTYEDKEEIRRKEIAEKRRASLALARTKIKSRASIRQEANTEIEKIKEENDKLKKDAEIQKGILEAEQQRLKPTIIKKYIRPKKEAKSQPSVPSVPDQSINYLAEQSYAEQLQIKLRENMINKIMMDTFM